MKSLALSVLLAAGTPSGSILANLQHLDQQLQGAESHLATLHEQTTALHQQLATLQTQIAAVKVRQHAAFVLFRRRVRALYRMPAGARLAVLGGAHSLTDYLQAARLLRWVAKHDHSLQEQYDQQTAALDALQTKLDAHRNQLAELTSQTRNERNQLGAARQQRIALLESIAHQRPQAERAGREERAARQALGSMLRKLHPAGHLSSTFSQNRGKLPWPAAGKVVRSFGEQVELAFGTTTTHNGLDIAAPTGSAVRAIAPGKVVFADWLKGYGQLVIIDHGDGFHSLMAHLATMQVSTGAQVKQGTLIGTVGDTGSLHGTELYFEIRNKGIPVNPLDWLRH